jgi:hypothetical protein
MDWAVIFKLRLLYPWGKNFTTHWIGGWVGPRAGLDVSEKWSIYCHRQESNQSLYQLSHCVCWLYDVLCCTCAKDRTAVYVKVISHTTSAFYCGLLCVCRSACLLPYSDWKVMARLGTGKVRVKSDIGDRLTWDFMWFISVPSWKWLIRGFERLTGPWFQY